MHAVDLLSTAIPESDAERIPLPSTPVDGICCVTGQSTSCVPRKDLLGKSFTDQSLLRAPESTMVGQAAWVALSYRWERMSSWWCDGQTFYRLDRPTVRDRVIGGVRCDRLWAGYITTSYKKHGALRAPVNTGERQVWLFELTRVDCSDRGRVVLWWEVMGQALRAGVSRRSMEELYMPPGIARKIGVDIWESYRRWAQDKWQSPLYGLLCYLLPSQEELRMERGAESSVSTTATDTVSTPVSKGGQCV